jgi:D-alanyl-lipoteichoic acid acyltransferase DltB (MBOAT superfamily)
MESFTMLDDSILFEITVNFTTVEFAAFMLLVYPTYLLLSHRWQNRMLLIASYFFYGVWDWRFLSLLMWSTIVDYWVSHQIQRVSDERIRFRYLLVSLVSGLTILGIFKYLGFFVNSAEKLLESIGLHANLPILSLVLPVGISFYTFQTLSYVIDVYRKQLRPAPNLLDFALYISFFPQLVAGPIERATHLLPQVLLPRTITYEQVSRGSFLILLGLFKKIVIADGVATAVNVVYGMPDPTALDIIVATYLFALQIYCDFSGYSDIARGTAKLMGFDLMVNFNLPYFSVNPREFWQRWHISLSTWLRDYLYVPLGGNKHGELKTYRNLMATMLLGGLWHGAAWNFVFWGIYQGAILCLHRFFIWQHNTVADSTLWKIIKILLFFQIICYGWLLFRANSLKQVIDLTTILFSGWTTPQMLHIPLPPLATLLAIPLLLSLDIYHYVTQDAHFYRRWAIPIRSLLYALLFFIVIAGTSNAPTQFIYFAF